MKTPTAFISYSWDNDNHRNWVRDFAIRLRQDGVDVTLDQWQLVPGDQLPHFMEKSIQSSDFVLVVCTPNYRAKSQNRVGGVGYEGDIITSELLVQQNQRKYIPILRQGEKSEAIPVWLAGKLYVDLKDGYSEQNYQEVLTTLLGTRPQPPVVGNKPQTAANPPAKSGESDEIKITGVMLEEVTTPRMDGTKGSALYTVPFRFSRRPSSDWARVFIHYWDNPSSYSTMHRRGIARIYGDKLLLEGTTLEEVELYHLDTLKLALQETNKAVRETEIRRQQQIDAEAERKKKHQDEAKDIANRLKFD